MRLKFGVVLLVVTAGCVPVKRDSGSLPNPSTEEIRKFVSSQTPPLLTLVDLQIISITGANGERLVQFESTLQPREPLYRVMDVERKLAELQWTSITVPHAGKTPAVFEAVQTPADQYRVPGGLVVTRSLVWQFNPVQWDAEKVVLGEPRGYLPIGAILWGEPQVGQVMREYARSGVFQILALRNGRTYRNARLQELRGDSVSIHHDKGILDIPVSNLPGFLGEGAPAPVRTYVSAPAAPPPSALPTAVPTTPSISPSAGPEKPPPPPSNLDDLIGEYIRPYTTSPKSITVRSQPPVFDETVWAWKVEFEYSFYQTGPRNTGGKRIEGSSYAWFRDKLVVRFGTIMPGRSLLD